MTNRANRLHLILCLAIGATALGGCGKKKAPPPPPPPPPRVAAPEPVRVETLAGDPRVQFPQSAAPTDESLARAVAAFATALAKGDDAALGAMLDAPAKGVLAMQVRSGEWKSATAKIEAVRVVRLTQGGDSADIGLAVQDPSAGGAYLTGWRAKQLEGAWVFTGLPVVAKSAPRAADLDNADLAPIAPPVAAAPAEKPAPAAPKPTEPAPAPAAAPASGGPTRSKLPG